jgi:predicted SprT family Zn-dependent metalloprotease
MRLSEAQTVAENLMSDHGLHNWTFEFNNRKRSLGICRHRLNVIGLSTYLLPSMDLDIVTNTILHEIAHALVGSGHGHGHIWRRKALEIGCDGERCSSLEIDENSVAKYVATCPDCGQKYNKHRRPKRLGCCRCIGGFDSSRALTYVQQY